MNVEQFEYYRPKLFGIAYRMLGSAMEAEDILQEAFLRTHSIPLDEIQMLGAYLRKTVVRLCMDQLKSAAATREVYMGSWLPEPLPTPDGLNEIERDSISMAFLTLLETLTPVERAVFLLREVFDYEYAEIAEIVGRDEAGCRQSFHRAKTHVATHKKRFQAQREAHETILTKFITAITTGDLQGLTALLAEDVVSYSDGGGKVTAALYPLHGVDRVARFFAGLNRFITPEYTLSMQSLNGTPSIIIYKNEMPFEVILLDLVDDRIQTIRAILNPDKLTAL